MRIRPKRRPPGRPMRIQLVVAPPSTTTGVSCRNAAAPRRRDALPFPVPAMVRLRFSSFARPVRAAAVNACGME